MPRTFVDDDLGYEEWLRSHIAGYVVICERRPKLGYVMLHRASCYTINGTPARDDGSTANYMKVCADTIAELELWTTAETGAQPHRCGSCAP